MIIASRYGGYIITRDSGETWDCNYSFANPWIPHFTALNDSMFYTFDENRLYRSSDSGLTWSTTLEIDGQYISTYSMNNENVGCALARAKTSPGQNWQLYTTTDGTRQ